MTEFAKFWLCCYLCVAFGVAIPIVPIYLLDEGPLPQRLRVFAAAVFWPWTLAQMILHPRRVLRDGSEIVNEYLGRDALWGQTAPATGITCCPKHMRGQLHVSWPTVFGAECPFCMTLREAERLRQTIAREVCAHRGHVLAGADDWPDNVCWHCEQEIADENAGPDHDADTEDS